MEDVKVQELRDDYGKPMFKVTTPKFKADFLVYKLENGFAFYGIKSTAPNQSKELEGNWLNPRDALKHLLTYIKNAKPSVLATRDMKYEKNHPKE